MSAPSLEVLGNGNQSDTNETAGRENVLVDLGIILLRISVKSDDELDLEQVPSSLNERRKFMCTHSGGNRMGRHYGQIIRDCAWFFEGDEVVADEEFRDKFFLKIIQPLKQLENSIK
ncbi:hypothetical protein O1611_g3235 [Lasiodiplodia mahajangana]|uniref:Uncharacterized protein n=1 Tax=Lasiodiplodia mahajangana TaxID=1108764 RepID=A0ACC2JSS0_9PEZI|nr:hypothetical protein O1611_g3235 [Lasiodiplodia mahajangana]